MSSVHPSFKYLGFILGLFMVYLIFYQGKVMPSSVASYAAGATFANCLLGLLGWFDRKRPFNGFVWVSVVFCIVALIGSSLNP